MPPVLLAICICFSIIFGFGVAYFHFKTDLANVYQKGRKEGDDERTALKEKLLARDTKLAELGRERETERAVAQAMQEELEALRSGSEPEQASQIAELERAFEQRATAMIAAEREAREVAERESRYAAETAIAASAERIQNLEARLAAAEAERAQAAERVEGALRKAELARQEAEATRAQLTEAQSFQAMPLPEAALSALQDPQAAEAQIAAQVNQASEAIRAEAAREIEQIRSELQQSLNDASAARERLHQMEALCSDAQAEAASAQATLDALRQSVSELQQAREQEAQARKAAEDALTQSRSQCAQALAEAAQLREQLAAQTPVDGAAQAEKSMLDLQLLREENSELRRLHEEAETRASEAEARLSLLAQPAGEQAETESRMEALKQEWDEKWQGRFDTLRQELEAAIERTRQEAHQQGIADAQKETEAQLAITRQEWEGLAESARLEAEAQIATARETSAQELAALRSELDRVKEDSLAQLAALRSAAQEDQVQTNSARDAIAQLASARMAAEAQAAGVQAELQAAREELVAKIAAAEQEAADRLAKARAESEALLANVRQESEAALNAARDEAESRLSAANNERDRLAEALRIQSEALRAKETELAEQRNQAAEVAAKSAEPPAELAALREGVLRLESNLQNLSGERATYERLNQEVNNLRQVAALSRAVCEGATRYAAQQQEMKSRLEAAILALQEGSIAYFGEVLTPARCLQSALPAAEPAVTEAAASPNAPAPVAPIEALQQAVETTNVETAAEV